jgi:hypothetical protein
MSEATFTGLLSQLIRAALESGLDPFTVHRCLSVAGMEAVGECRCDLTLYDEGGDEAPF